MSSHPSTVTGLSSASARLFPPRRCTLFGDLCPLPCRQRRRSCRTALQTSTFAKGDCRRVFAGVRVSLFGNLPGRFLHDLEGALTEITRALRVSHAESIARRGSRDQPPAREIETDPLPQLHEKRGRNRARCGMSPAIWRSGVRSWWINLADLGTTAWSVFGRIQRNRLKQPSTKPRSTYVSEYNG